MNQWKLTRFKYFLKLLPKNDSHHTILIISWWYLILFTLKWVFITKVVSVLFNLEECSYSILITQWFWNKASEETLKMCVYVEIAQPNLYKVFVKNQKVRLNLREMNMNMEVLCASGDGGDILFILFFNPHILEHRYLLQM